MALRLSSIISSTTPLRRRLPLVGAFCMLSLGLSNLCPSLSLASSKIATAQSLPFATLLRYSLSLIRPPLISRALNVVTILIFFCVCFWRNCCGSDRRLAGKHQLRVFILSEWKKRITKPCRVLLCMLLCPTKKQVTVSACLLLDILPNLLYNTYVLIMIILLIFIRLYLF